MKKTASEIKDEMREEARASNARIAQRTAQQALDGLREALQQSPTFYALADCISKQDVDELLLEVDTYATLLAELVSALPDRVEWRKANTVEPAPAAAEAEEKAA